MKRPELGRTKARGRIATITWKTVAGRVITDALDTWVGCVSSRCLDQG